MDIDSVPTSEERYERNVCCWHLVLLVLSVAVLIRDNTLWWAMPANIVFNMYFGAKTYYRWRYLQVEREYRRKMFASWREKVSNPPPSTTR